MAALPVPDEQLSVLIWTEKGEKVQDVAAFQERLKGKINPPPKPHTFSIIPRLHHVVCAEVHSRGKRGEEQDVTRQFQIVQGERKNQGRGETASAHVEKSAMFSRGV